MGRLLLDVVSALYVIVVTSTAQQTQCVGWACGVCRLIVRVRETGETLRECSMGRILYGTIYILWMCGAVFVANVTDTCGYFECERRVRHSGGGGWGDYFAELFLRCRCAVQCRLQSWRMRVDSVSAGDR